MQWLRLPPARAIVVRTLFGVVVASSVVAAWARLVSLTKQATDVVGLQYDDRREVMMGDFYPSLRRIRQGVPQDAPVGLVLRHVQDIDRAVFVNYYLYPRSCRWYFAVDPNAFAFEPRKPSVLLDVDVTRPGVVRRVSEAEAVFDAFRGKGEAHHLAPKGPEYAHLVVPLATASLGGKPGEVYATDAMLSSSVDTIVNVVFEPAGIRRTLTLNAGGTLKMDNIVFATFGATRTGWLDVSARNPIRGGFWLVDLARHRSTPLPVVTDIPRLREHFTNAERVWFLNFENRVATVTVNGSNLSVRPHALAVLPISSAIDVECQCHVFAFASSESPVTGDISFQWPPRTR